ncbi:MAG: hypothetical protein ACFB9M_14020 [Myxococcota bacterium]
MLELSTSLPLRRFRMEASYTAARLAVGEETRPLARDFEEAAEKFRLLEEEEARLDLTRVQVQASLEAADDAWDDAMMSFRRRLLEACENDVDADLYRKYFADIPSHVTSLSYAAEQLISAELERALRDEEDPSLEAFAPALEAKRIDLERNVREQTRLEVDEARFVNRVAMAKAILNKLRRVLFASLEEIALARGRGREWCARFFLVHQHIQETVEGENEDPLLLPEGPAQLEPGDEFPSPA